MLPWRAGATKRGYDSSIALPLIISDDVIGVMSIYALEFDAFDQDEIALLKELSEDLAFGIRTLRLHQKELQSAQQIRKGFEDTLQAIATTVEMRDPYTAGHQKRVSNLAAAIAVEMGLPQEQVRSIELASFVHDIGKISLPAEILSKPSKLSEIEYSLIKEHPQVGFNIFKGIDFPWPIGQAILQHHERIDGSGYPQGLKGDEIIIEARIIAVADVVEAMSSHRPYRPGLGLDVALSEINSKRSIYFDPAVVDACLTLFNERGYVLPS